LCAPYKPGRMTSCFPCAGKQVVGNQGPVTYDVTQISPRSPCCPALGPAHSLIRPTRPWPDASWPPKSGRARWRSARWIGPRRARRAGSKSAGRAPRGDKDSRSAQCGGGGSHARAEHPWRWLRQGRGLIMPRPLGISSEKARQKEHRSGQSSRTHALYSPPPLSYYMHIKCFVKREDLEWFAVLLHKNICLSYNITAGERWRCLSDDGRHGRRA
jgi:hypothetical protein